MWREESLIYTVRACANSGRIPPAPVTIPYTIVHQLSNELFIPVGIIASHSETIDKAVSYAPSASLLSRFTPWARLQNSARSKSAGLQRGAIVIRRGCGCRCGLGAEKCFSSLRESVDPKLHTYLADKVRETVLVVYRYVRNCLKPSGRSLFTLAELNSERRIISRVERQLLQSRQQCQARRKVKESVTVWLTAEGRGPRRVCSAGGPGSSPGISF